MLFVLIGYNVATKRLRASVESIFEGAITYQLTLPRFIWWSYCYMLEIRNDSIHATLVYDDQVLLGVISGGLRKVGVC